MHILFYFLHFNIICSFLFIIFQDLFSFIILIYYSSRYRPFVITARQMSRRNANRSWIPFEGVIGGLCFPVIF